MNKTMYGHDATLVEITYDQNGEPIVLVRGKQRERRQDLEKIKDWMRAFAKHIGA